jgi:hypothetical protein
MNCLADNKAGAAARPLITDTKADGPVRPRWRAVSGGISGPYQGFQASKKLV